MYEYDLIIIGGGPAGETAAIHASNLGLKVCIVEQKEYLGGTCLNVGCIPTKALIEAAKIFHNLKYIKNLGFEISDIKYEWQKILMRKNNIVTNQRKGLALLMQNKNVNVYFKCKAQIITPNNVLITNIETQENKILTTKYILIATGSKNKNFNLINIDENTVLSSDGILSIEQIPSSLGIIGGGIIGVEFACLFANFGCKVSIFEILPTILPTQDKECSKEIEKFLKRAGIKIFTNTQIKNIEIQKDNVVKIINHQDEEFLFEKILIAIGRTPNIQDLWNENIKIQIDQKNFIQTNINYQTNYENIYAVGDVINTPALAHVASHEAIHAVEHMCQHNPQRINYLAYPNVIYTIPELASAGYTTEELDNKKISYDVAKFPFAPLAKATIENSREGFVKVLFDKQSKQILGAHIIHHKASDLISEMTLAISCQLDLEKLKNIIHPHPTISEAIGECMYTAFYKPKTLHM